MAGLGGEPQRDARQSPLMPRPIPNGGLAGDVPKEMERIAHHCLEKSPETCFQSARDLAFALRGLADR